MHLLDTSASEVVQRVVDATNAHDLDALVDCFAPDYVNRTPAHPGRSFVGREQVRRNWAQLFAAMPDLQCEVLAAVVDGAHVWSEWEMRGTRPDQSAHLMRGVLVFEVAEGLVQSVRFYLEPVDEGASSVDDAIAAAVRGAPR